jgi:hypothetical protein
MDRRDVLTALIGTGDRENVWLEYEMKPNGYVRGFRHGLSGA